MAWRVVILGGGFGGLYTARKLEKLLPAGSARVTLINDVNFMLYTPLLPGAAGGTLEPRHVVVPLREQLKRTHLKLARVTGADPSRREVTISSPEGNSETLTYDQLVVTIGSTSRTLPIPGLAEYAVGFKTLSEAIALRNRLVHTLEHAESIEDDEARHSLLTYVFVGAGYAGVEGLAELHRRGIEIRRGTTIERVSADSTELSTGEVIPTRTVAWTAGVKPHPIVGELGLPLDGGGRIKVDRYCQVEGFSDVWAIGDAAAVPDPARPGLPCPPTCQHAIRQGRTVGANVAAALGQGRKKPFTYKTLGVFVDMGRYQAVAETLGIRWRGFPAWFLARTYHLYMMPGLRRRARLVTDWTVGLLFGRDSSELGQLGHPPQLAMPGLSEQSVGGTAPDGSGRPEDANVR